MRKKKREVLKAETRAKEPEEDIVKLTPFLGIRPGVYLVYIYCVVILLVFFFVFVYPGLKNPGSRVDFDSEPRGAAVRVDDVYLATTPDTVFIPRGTHSVEMVLPGFEPYRTEYTFPGMIFASLFIPPEISMRGELDAKDPLEVLRIGAEEAAEWSFAGEPNAAWQIPLSLSDAAYRAGPGGADPAVHAETENILVSSLRYTVTRAGLRDLIRAELLAENGGLSPSPLTLIRSMRETLALLSANPGAASWLAALLPDPAASRVVQSAWYRETTEAAARLAERDGMPGGGGFEAGIEIAGITFLDVRGGEFTVNGAFPRRLNIEDFSIAQKEIDRASWEAFIRENPGERYPDNSGPGMAVPGGPAESAGNISYHAAVAYCKWLSGYLPPDLAAWEVRLPTEAEWEYAARLVYGKDASAPPNAGSPAPRDMLGGLWEWCADAFAPLDFFPVKTEYPPEAPERSVRGGAWINNASSVNTATRASLPPDTRSPFVGFRAVIARKASAKEGD
jgi:formylglycine-generating enzyme required for sulfatase activity